MENSSEFCSLQYRGRSISLPSRLQHPNSIKIDSLLSKLRSFKTESLTGEMVQCGLVRLVELQNCLEEFMESSPTSHFTLAHYYPCRLIMEDTLKRSMEILDSTGLIRDLCLMIKERVHLLQSALRRKNGGSRIHKDIKAYFHFRKAVKKEASKILSLLKRMENRSETVVSLHTDQNRAVIIRVLRESNAIAIGVLRSLLIYLTLPSSRFKQGGKFLFAIFARLKIIDFERGQGFSDLGCVDFVLDGHIRNNESKGCLQLARTRLQILDTRIEALENGLEHLFRGLVRNQVNLLNIFNH